MTDSRGSRFASAIRPVRVVLLLVGLGCLGWAGFVALRGHLVQIDLRHELAAIVRQGGLGVASAGEDSPAPGELVGRIRIPRVDLDVMAVEGVDKGNLDRGAGHLTGSALPGEPGNVVFAGHRDTFFSPLRHVEEGDSVLVTTPWGRHAYTVDSITVVDPEDTWVAEGEGRSVLTLITCYPFHSLGPAPRRMVITAVPRVDEASQAMRERGGRTEGVRFRAGA